MVMTKYLLIIATVFSLFSCGDGEEVTPMAKKTTVPSLKVSLVAENTSTNPTSHLIVELYTMDSVTRERTYILKDTIPANKWSKEIDIKQGDKIYWGLWRTDFKGDNGGLKSSATASNGVTYNDYIENDDYYYYQTNTTWPALTYEFFQKAL